jgi:predicted nucleic acid-binding protein
VKYLLDTNVWIRFFRDPLARERFERHAGRPMLFMSSIVALELLAGCRTSREQREVERFLKPFEKAGRLIVPDHWSLLEAGRVLAALGSEGISVAHRRQMINHLVIAVTAARAGVRVVTANTQDFTRIERYTTVRWTLPG